MTTDVQTHDYLASEDLKRITATTALTATGATDWIKLAGELVVQITGDATAVTATVQRSAVDPSADGSTADPAPAGDDITGDPSSGIQPIAYLEPGVAWWRVNVTALTGDHLRIAISGKGW